MRTDPTTTTPSVETQPLRVFCCGPCQRERVDGEWIDAKRPEPGTERVSDGLCAECELALFGDCET